jgi:hypothetical protein
VTRARDDVEKLRCRVNEVENLRNEEEYQSLAEVTHDADHGKDHSSKIAVRVSHEDLGGEPVMLEEGEGYSEEW